MTAPQINDTSSNHQYVFAVNELAAYRTVTLPLLAGNDTFVFENHAQVLANKSLVGTTTNDSAAAGHVGEYIQSVIVSGSAVALTSTTPANLTSISLTAGDWVVDAVFQFTGNAATTVTYLIGSISTTSATLDNTAGAAAGRRRTP